MDNSGNPGRKESERDDLGYRPEWPQRPARPQPPAMRPRLDPPAPRAYRSSETPDPDAQGARQSQPRREETKETRILPVVEPPSSDPSTQSTRPYPRPAAHPPGSIPQVPRTPAPPVVPQQAPTQAPVRKPGGWQYERDEEYAGYNPQAYEPQKVELPGKRTDRSDRKAPEPGRGYISVNVEGTRKRRLGWLLWPLVGLLAVAIIGVVAFGLAWQGQYAGKIYAGVSVLDTDLSGKTPDEAEKLLRDKVAAFVGQPVILTWRGKEWRPTAEQLGIKVDVEGSVDEAFRVGRGSDALSNVAQQWAAAQTGYMVPLTVQISEPALKAYLETIAKNEIDQEIFEGDVRLNGTEVVALPGKEGRTLKVYDSIRAIREQAAKLEQGKIDLPVEIVQPSVTAEEVGYVQGLLGVRVSAPITATVPGGPAFTIDRDALVRFTTIERNPDRTASRHVELGWNDNELKVLGERWAGEANRPAKNARFAWNDGALSVMSESMDGFEVDATTVISSIKEHAGTTDSREYALPGKIITPTVSSKDIAALGIKELMGTGTSTFKGSSEERAINIRVAAELLNGAVVPPGGTFSFLQTMGGIDEAHGFVEGYVIAAERTQRGVGGGVCQVSTTAFRAAFWSGVEITERNQHSYRVGWYEANGEPVGFDAAVFDPGVDLKFFNNSPGYVLIQAGVGSEVLTVNFYGTKLPGEVKLEGPAISNRTPPPSDVYQVDERLPAGTKKQVETARAGLDTVITRRIIVPGQPDKIDQFHSAYRAWPNWYIVASASQIPGGAPSPPNPTPNP